MLQEEIELGVKEIIKFIVLKNNDYHYDSLNEMNKYFNTIDNPNIYSLRNHYQEIYDKNIIAEQISSHGFIFELKETGSASGGGCWGGESVFSPTSDSDSKKLLMLDQILEDIAPNISYLQYKKLLVEANLENIDIQHNEYYGNYTAYNANFISCEKLVNFLIEKNVLLDDENLIKSFNKYKITNKNKIK
jgi:hypothetical protein